MRRLPVALAIAAIGAHASLWSSVAEGREDAEVQPTNAPAPTPTAPSESAPAATRTITLHEAEQTALAHQPQVLVARANTEVARAQAEQAFSPLLPQVTGTASYTRKTNNIVPGALPVSTSQAWPQSESFNAFSFGISGTQLVYDFGQTFQRYRAAEFNVGAQEQAEKTALLQIVFNVRRAFFGARANKELVDVARETLDDQRRHLVQVQAFVQVGTQPPIALAQQRAAVANAQVQLITAQNNYETAKAQLDQAAGIATGTDYDVADDELATVEDEDEALDRLAAKAISARPELASLEKERQAQERTLSSARGGYGPSVAVTAGATEAGSALDSMAYNWSAAAVLTWPIFQGGLTKGQVHQAEAGLQSLDAQYVLEELQVRLDVDSARLAVRAAKASMGAAQDALASARDQLRLAEQRYATGVGSIIELTDAQVSYTTAAAQVVQARYGLSSARAQLLAALGRT